MYYKVVEIKISRKISNFRVYKCDLDIHDQLLGEFGSLVDAEEKIMKEVEGYPLVMPPRRYDKDGKLVRHFDLID